MQYVCMHRTQLLLDDWQYEALHARAERESRSLSDLLREILREALAAPPSASRRRLEVIEGIGDDAAVGGKDHDRHPYGVANKR